MIFDGKKRYRVVLHGSGILIPCENGSEPITGFHATRFVRATTPEKASAVAIGILRNEWFNSPYSTVNRVSGPAIVIKEIEHVTNPFRRSRPNKGYAFYQHGEGPEDRGKAEECENGAAHGCDRDAIAGT